MSPLPPSPPCTPAAIRSLHIWIGRVTGSCRLSADFAAIDYCWEIRRFLARVALESPEDAWSLDAAEMIGWARLDLATSQQDNLRQVVACDWPTSNGLISEALLARFRRRDR